MLEPFTIKDLIAGIVASVLAFLSWRNGQKLQEVHVTMNSRLDQLLKAKGDASYAQGQADQLAANPQPPTTTHSVTTTETKPV